jgi:hypothetical protein
MNIQHRKKIVLLGMTALMPVAGNVWLILQYLLGLQRLGYDVYYVEAHGATPTKLMQGKDDEGSARAAAFLDGILRRFDLGHRWCFHALHSDGRCYGMSEGQLNELYRSAAAIINLHGATVPRPEHYASGRLVYLETDPVGWEVRIANGDLWALAVLKAHSAHFTWGLNYGNPDCRVPLPDGITFRPTRPPVVLDLWENAGHAAREVFTTVGNWRQPGDVTFQGETYTWSKHHEFLKFIDLPLRTSQRFELALARCSDDDRQLLEGSGWRVRPATGFSTDLDAYRDYLIQSRGEFTVAKDQNVRLRSGWFSERSTQYLAAGRPVITQETGFSSMLPGGEGLFGFSMVGEALAAVEAINANYERHCRAASTLAREWFSYEVVLRQLLSEIGS